MIPVKILLLLSDLYLGNVLISYLMSYNISTKIKYIHYSVVWGFLSIFWFEFVLSFREEKSEDLGAQVNYHNMLRPLNKSNQVKHVTFSLES